MANTGNFAFCSNTVCRVFSLSSGLLMIFNFLKKSASCGWRKGGLIQFQWKDLVGELQVWVNCAALQFSVALSKSTEYLCSLEKFWWGNMAECRAASWKNEDLKVLSDQILHKVLLTWAQKTQILIQSQAFLDSTDTEITSCQIHLNFVQKVLHQSSNWMLWISTITKIYSSFSWNANM